VSEAAIRVESLEKWFPPTQGGWRAFLQPFLRPTFAALRGISLEVQPGEAVALLGANGAGKTTLLRILATLLVPTKGHALLAGHDTEKEPAAVRKNLGYHAGSDLGFYARLSGRENLRFFGRLNHLEGADLEGKIQKFAKRFELEDVIDRQVRTLSSGTVQRLSLLRALLHEPIVLLLDEPTRSLDAIAAAEFRHFLKSEVLAQRRASVLFASHTLPEIEFLADRVAILHDGKVLAIDSPAALQKTYDCASLEDAFLRATGRNVSFSEEAHPA
jgi:ABC-type multidrug transport system ATPase subunit